jgi:hypothetical protein
MAPRERPLMSCWRNSIKMVDGVWLMVDRWDSAARLAGYSQLSGKSGRSVDGLWLMVDRWDSAARLAGYSQLFEKSGRSVDGLWLMVDRWEGAWIQASRELRRPLRIRPCRSAAS